MFGRIVRSYLRVDVFLYHRRCMGIYTVCILKISFWNSNSSFPQRDCGIRNSSADTVIVLGVLHKSNRVLIPGSLRDLSTLARLFWGPTSLLSNELVTHCPSLLWGPTSLLSNELVRHTAQAYYEARPASCLTDFSHTVQACYEAQPASFLTDLSHTLQACYETHPSSENKAVGTWPPPVVLFTLSSKYLEISVRSLRLYAYVA